MIKEQQADDLFSGKNEENSLSLDDLKQKTENKPEPIREISKEPIHINESMKETAKEGIPVSPEAKLSKEPAGEPLKEHLKEHHRERRSKSFPVKLTNGRQPGQSIAKSEKEPAQIKKEIDKPVKPVEVISAEKWLKKETVNPSPSRNQEMKKTEPSAFSQHVKSSAEKMPESEKIVVKPAQTPSSQAPRKIHGGDKLRTEGSFGQILQEARVYLNLSIEQVSIRTRIDKYYLEALERDDLKSLPAPVYVNAYVRTLCHLYNIPEKEICEKIKQENKPLPVPEKILQHIEKGGQVNEEEKKKFNRFILSLSAAALFIVLSTGFVLYKMKWEKIEKPVTAISVRTDESYKYFSEQTERFIAPQIINMTELKQADK